MCNLAQFEGNFDTNSWLYRPRNGSGTTGIEFGLIVKFNTETVASYTSGTGVFVLDGNLWGYFSKRHIKRNIYTVVVIYVEGIFFLIVVL